MADIQLLDDHDIAEVPTEPRLEALSAVEQRLLGLAKAEAERHLQDTLRLIIAEHGYDPNNGKRYDFVEDPDATPGTIALKVT